MKFIVISFSVLLLLCGTVLSLAFAYLGDQGPRGMIDDLYTGGKLFLYKYDMVDELSSGEIRQLYESTCNRKCHSKDVIEKHPRTSLEWEWIVARMQVPDRAGINDRQAEAITRYLQEHFLSNVPTIMPERTMRFVKRHLWRSDFGETDLYLDIIYVPRVHVSLLPYLIARASPPESKGRGFRRLCKYPSGHHPSVGSRGNGHSSQWQWTFTKAGSWNLLYEDGQGHHKQGILTFPPVDERSRGSPGGRRSPAGDERETLSVGSAYSGRCGTRRWRRLAITVCSWAASLPPCC